MQNSRFSKVLSLMLALLMLVSVLPVNALAARLAVSEYDSTLNGTGYYKVISEKKWDLAPGVKETELVLNNAAGTRRQVLHTAIIDVNNEFVKVIPGTKGMWPQPGNYATQSTSVQALEAEKLGHGNVVVATNASLSWYTEAYYKQNPHLIGEPLGYSILDGQLYANSRYVEGKNNGGVQTIVVINYDNHPLTGDPRPEDMPKVWIRSAMDPLTGWEEQAIPVLFTFLVKPDANGNPVNQYSKNGSEDHGSGIASRTFVGVRADGTLVLAVSDGEQAPYSTGFTSYEMAEYMINMGCVIAANCDGGGSTTFCSQRPGEDLKVNCSLSDGGERPTTNTFLVVSTAPADGKFARAQITSEYEYYTPGSTVTFSTMGTDAVGTKVEIPADVEWKIKEENMGTIADGVFTSNGTAGKVTAQMVYDGKVVGECAVTLADPDKIYFEQPVVTVPFGKSAVVPVKASANGIEIGLGVNDIEFTTTNEALGSFEGLTFVPVDETNAPEELTSTVTAKLKSNPELTATVQLNLGRASQVLWDFEGGQADIDIWNVVNNRKNAAHWDYELALSLADATNGKVHDGNYSMRLETNGLHSKDSHSEQYAWIRLGVDGEAITLKNARSVGFWLYVPEDNIQCWVQGHYKTDSNGDGVFDTDNVVSMMESENVYYNIDESGWHYLSMDISAFQEVALQADKQYDIDPADGMTGDKGEFFLALVFHKGINNKLWQENGSINGNYTYYLDNFTVDYSDAVEDRENPVFGASYVNGAKLVKRDVVTTTSNVLNVSAEVADATTKKDANKNDVPLYNATGLNADSAKVYIDGVEVECSFVNGAITAKNIMVADGYHRVKFEICDKAGNKSVVIRVVNVASGIEASTIKVVPADADLDRIPFGSIYWMNLEATNIESIQSVSTVIDLNNVNHWELDHMELAPGFTAEYDIAEETNTATITITRTGENSRTGEAILASLPVRILNFDDDIKTPGYTAETYWTTYPFWAQDMKLDVDKGEITFVDGYKSAAMGVFSNEEFHVDTEMYTIMANMDKAYFAAHGTTHVHTPAAAADKAATCSETGYTGRTICTECNSPVIWGTSIAMTDHAYEVKDGSLICSECETVLHGTGLQNVGGKNYYAVNGVLTGGWITVDDEWYYFDKTTFVGPDGAYTTGDGIQFVFDNGRLTTGAWQETANGKRYWYGPGFYKDTSPELTSCRAYEIDGNTYLFDRYGYMQTGIAKFFTGEYSLYYDCGTTGAAVLLTGPYNGNFFKDGLRLRAYQLVEFNGDYYYISDGNKIATNTKLYLDKAVEGMTYPDGSAMKPGNYEFDAEGKMVLKNGPIDGYFYKNGVKQLAYQLVEYEGNYYYISDGHKIATNEKLYLDKAVEGMTYPDGSAMKPGNYEFDDEGKLILKNGPIDGYFYLNGLKQLAYQLVEFEGNYYYISDGHKLATNDRLYLDRAVEGKFFADGTPMNPGYYEFDAEGKLIMKNGPIDGYFYKNGVKQYAYQLVEFEGNYYYISDGHKLATNARLYFDKAVEGKTFPDGTAMNPGYYEFDAEGKLIMKNGPIDGYFYKNGVKQYAYQLVEFEGNYYYISDGHKLATNTRLYFDKAVEGKTFSDGTPMKAGYYEFDAQGKMVVKNGPSDGFFYKNGVKQLAYQLVEFEGNYYYITDGHKLAVNTRLYLSKAVEGKFFPDGTPMQKGYYYFDAEGRMILN